MSLGNFIFKFQLSRTDPWTAQIQFYQIEPQTVRMKLFLGKKKKNLFPIGIRIVKRSENMRLSSESKFKPSINMQPKEHENQCFSVDKILHSSWKYHFPFSSGELLWAQKVIFLFTLLSTHIKLLSNVYIYVECGLKVHHLVWLKE